MEEDGPTPQTPRVRSLGPSAITVTLDPAGSELAPSRSPSASFTNTAPDAPLVRNGYNFAPDTASPALATSPAVLLSFPSVGHLSPPPTSPLDRIWPVLAESKLARNKLVTLYWLSPR